MTNQTTTEPTDDDVMTAVMNADPDANDVFPYPDLAPFRNHGLEQFMEALQHLGMQLVVKPLDA
jgi:hypothetical protein